MDVLLDEGARLNSRTTQQINSLGKLIGSVEHQLKELKHSLGMYKKDPRKYQPQLENLEHAASATQSACSAIIRKVERMKYMSVEPDKLQ